MAFVITNQNAHKVYIAWLIKSLNCAVQVTNRKCPHALGCCWFTKQNCVTSIYLSQFCWVVVVERGHVDLDSYWSTTSSVISHWFLRD